MDTEDNEFIGYLRNEGPTNIMGNTGGGAHGWLLTKDCV
jgi:hypothetical protein